MQNQYEMVVGLEVHAELSTRSKIYCSCHNQFGLEVNSVCCPICMGFPGALPTLNKKVVEYAIKMGHALHCTIHNICKQDRKNYFYPDLPKAYQISQADIPLCENGYLDVLVNDKEVKRIGITRIHIEEDAGKLLHDNSFDGSLVDFNRCGVPLIEIVSEPDFRSSEQAKAYLETIRSYLLYLGISDAKMQEGSIRCDVNVSVHKPGEPFGTRCEMKNVNTFSGAVRAIEYEYVRQVEQLNAGIPIEQETRKWDDLSGKTIPLRSKENANDYRYFPEPDLKTIFIPKEEVDTLKEQIPEMPNDKTLRYQKEYNLSFTDASLLAEDLVRAHFFEQILASDSRINPRTVAHWILGEVSKVMNETGKSPSELGLKSNAMAQLLLAIDIGTISNTAGKTVFSALLSGDQNVDRIIEENGLKQISDSHALEQIVDEVLAANEKSVSDYRSGKTNALGYLVGQCMKASKGKGNPSLLKETLLKRLTNRHESQSKNT